LLNKIDNCQYHDWTAGGQAAVLVKPTRRSEAMVIAFLAGVAVAV
jgi:hypothetical protein